ncbi:metallophosphoesterase [Ramlibacter sp. CrO1]|uniref:Metallophosphoesterase n=1 Tax=Ramlibacter algicola TaxID=2795217 RepID=A0A934UTD4_9BURK|nr:metallophosphoesterase [Ramlibacter algicola]MBK0394826.1 metallophosphoesterase [Ramlibacter algicola]
MKTARRRRWIGWTFLVLALLAVYAVGVEPRWTATRRIEASVPGWSRPPLKVAVASDWHITRRPLGAMTLDRAAAIVAQINAANPDVVLLPGDFIAGDGDPASRGEPDAQEIAAVLGKLRAPLGVYAVLGNHDWWADGPAVAEALKRRGIQVLENDAREIDAGLWVAGIGDHMTGHSNPVRTVAAVPPRAHALVVMHDPASLLDLPAVQGLAVAGHMHAGQVRLPGHGALITPGRAPRSWSYGWVDHRGLQAWVTSGLGTSILPVRFNARPEWVLLVVGAAAG